MTLLEMATVITTEMGLYDDTSMSLCRGFLSKAYITLWDKYAWNATQIVGTTSAAPGGNRVPCPDGIGMAIVVRATDLSTGTPGDPPDPDTPDVPLAPEAMYRSDSRFLDPVTSMFLVQTDPTIFERGGHVKYFEEDTDDDGTKNLRVYPTPQVDTELLVVGKRDCPGLTADADSSIIPNLDPAIMAYAYFDMLQRQRQYQKAELKRKEAQELEVNAWNIEQQQANRPRLTKTTTVAGNSLAEMTDAVCVICAQWTPDYRLTIAEFLRRNYQAAYDTFLWPESMVVVRVPYTTEQVVMPNYVDKVVGVRGTNNSRLSPADLGLLLDVTPQVFEQVGDPISYSVLTPVAVAIIPPAITKLRLSSTSTIDRGPVAIRGEIIAGGI